MTKMKNTSLNSSNEYLYPTLDNVLTAYGSTWALDYIHLYGYTFVSIAGFVLSFFSFKIFLDTEFNIPLYAYLRVYCINNAISSFVSIFSFTYTTYRIFDWSNSWTTQFYYNCIMVPIVNISYLYCSVLNIVITLDRISYFNARMRNFFKLSPYKISLISFVVSFLVDLPYCFIYVPTPAEVKLNQTFTFTIWYSYPSEFASTLLGQILLYIIYALRDVGVTFIQIGLNIVSIYLLKKHFSKKIRIKKRSRNSFSMQAISIKQNLPMAEKSNGTEVDKQRKGTKSMTRSDERATIMAICMCVFSVFEHGFMVFTIVYSYFYLNLSVFVFYMIADGSQPFKCCFDFFIFLAYNKVFRKSVMKYLRINRRSC
jgi:hypothetical protein